MYKQLIGLTAAVVAAGLFGCAGTAPRGELLVVNFQEQQPLRYRMVSERRTLIDLTEGGSQSGNRSQAQTMTERMELVMVYTPTEVDPFGLTTLQARCESVKVTRQSFSGRQEAADAVEHLPELPFTLTLTPTGRIEDDSDFRRVVRALGDKAFADTRASAGRVKNPDMISDFIALQSSLWDAIASMEDPTAGLWVGKTWQARQLLPWPAPMPIPPTRVVTFKLERLAEEDQQQKAYISSTYKLTDDYIKNVPPAYEGTFQMRGLFGFLRRYRFESIDGSGTQVFDVDAGILEKDEQHYTLNVEADFALPLGESKPILEVEQTLSIELLK